MAAKDAETDGSPEMVRQATEYLWREVTALRWHDANGAMRLAAADLARCVNSDGVVSARQVRRVALWLAQDKRWLVNNESSLVPASRPSGSSGGSVGSRSRSVMARSVPRLHTDAPEHKRRPSGDTGGGRIPSDYVSPA